MSFLDFCLSSNWEERESGIQSLGIKENVPKVTYLIFRRGSTGEFFFVHRANRRYSIFFYTGLKNLGSFLSQIFFCLQPGVLAMVLLPATDPAQKLLLIIYFRWGEGVPTSVLGSQPIIWLLSSSPWCPATWVRSPSTNICLYPLWPTFFS